MATRRTIPLPAPALEYAEENEAVTRRTIEFTFQTLENDIELAKTQGDKPGSLAMRRFQFLLMGASGG
ncbi:MAG: hypothetical protein CMP14_11960 [Rickettsiales bacterium]|jgi:hypothetical protein|nr:hypothetical protein [Rickettsiales bacterium]|tara:strand:- start:729 stop:932 length:204 start_codon:yes stop_codon:yes gene_type:complete